ncbi:hypothetical protein B5C34_06845 [Pacificimonas flava]|uniref:L,D-TPase catalytic domain-containing protein n=3 Tax=Sphingosinicellaceae TaxID=2820280 RepID=A0A219B8F4_9SPHN|nr:hypothetical protein B5C34_06845 [Pacificimonas flava]
MVMAAGGLAIAPAQADDATAPYMAADDGAPSLFDVELKPGEFIWEPELAADGEVHAYVDLGRQLVHVYRGDTRIGMSTISSGMPGHETPTGTFEILQKRVEHYSNLYNNAPMPYMQRLTWDGIAFHVGKLPGEPASHGCIRLPREFAMAFFDTTSMGGVVEIAGLAGVEDPQLAAGDFREAPLTPEAQTAELNRAAANGELDIDEL